MAKESVTRRTDRIIDQVNRSDKSADDKLMDAITKTSREK